MINWLKRKIKNRDRIIDSWFDLVLSATTAIAIIGIIVILIFLVYVSIFVLWRIAIPLNIAQ